MKIGGYETKIKAKILSVNKTIYPGDRKRFTLAYTYDDHGHERSMWKEFDTKQEALAYITEIEKLIV